MICWSDVLTRNVRILILKQIEAADHIICWTRQHGSNNAEYQVCLLKLSVALFAQLLVPGFSVQVFQLDKAEWID